MQVDTHCRLTRAEPRPLSGGDPRQLRSAQCEIVFVSRLDGPRPFAKLPSCLTKAPCRLSRHAGCHKSAVDRAVGATQSSASRRVAHRSCARKEHVVRATSESVLTCMSGTPCRLPQIAGGTPRAFGAIDALEVSRAARPCRRTRLSPGGSLRTSSTEATKSARAGSRRAYMNLTHRG